MDHSRTVLEFWFGREPLTPALFAARMPGWFGGGDADTRAARDATITAHFGVLAARAAAGALDNWADSPRQRLALILLLDQFPRHIHRGLPRAFATDDRAAALTLDGMQKAADATLDPAGRMFFYMPLQHSEAADVQEESVAAFRRLLRRVAAGMARTARGHARLRAACTATSSRASDASRIAMPSSAANRRPRRRPGSTAGGERFGS